MSKFKIGDKVKVVTNTDGIEGWDGVVKQADKIGLLVDFGWSEWWLYEEELESAA